MKSSYLIFSTWGGVLSWRTRVKPAWFTVALAADPSGDEAVSRLWRGHGRIETQPNPSASRPSWAMVMWTKGLDRQISLWINFDAPQKLLLLKFAGRVVASEGHGVFEFDRCPCQFQYSSVNRLAWKIQGTWYSGLHDLYVLMPTASFQVGTSRFPGSYFYRQMALVPVPTWLENILAWTYTGVPPRFLASPVLLIEPYVFARFASLYLLVSIPIFVGLNLWTNRSSDLL